MDSLSEEKVFRLLYRIMRLFIAILFEENIINALTQFQDNLKAKGYYIFKGGLFKNFCGWCRIFGGRLV